MAVVFFDTETTGIGSKDRLCQLAMKERGVADALVNSTYRTAVPISLEAMAVHHITEKMLEGRPHFQESEDYADIKALFEHEHTIAVAHNAAFDLGMLAREGITPAMHICTYKVAKAMDPDEELSQYKLQYLRYFMGIEVEAVAHDAMGDVQVLEGVFENLLRSMTAEYGSEEQAIEEMINISSRPLLFTTLRFGKHKGRKIADVVDTDKDYIRWLLDQKRRSPEGEDDWIHTLEYYLEQAGIRP